MNFATNQLVTRKELTQVLCEDEIKSGLITDDKPLMSVAIIEGRFNRYTGGTFRIEWLDETCKNGIVKPAYSFTEKDRDYLNSLGTVDTSEYE